MCLKLLQLLLLFVIQVCMASKACRCTPDQGCWPSLNEWNIFNETVDGRLIETRSIAQSCYPGVSRNLTKCAYVTGHWSNQTFQSSNPLGLSYPLNLTCPPVNYTAQEIPGSCTIGSDPVYAVNVSCHEHTVAALQFAQRHNIRIVIKSTGHDILGRSTGFGSLELWLRNFRQGIDFQHQYMSPDNCQTRFWNGSAIRIKGAYTWEDVYPLAEQNNVIVVGGGTPSVGAMGGWMQGGGHGPASRQFGLGADQVLDAQVALANGSIVTVTPCQHQDLFFAIRGGGPGTYGVVLSTTVKAWPMINSIAVQHLAIAPLQENKSALLDAVSLLFSAFPDLNDAGYAGYGSWTIDSPIPLFANFTAGYIHGIYMFDKTISDAKKAFQSVSIALTVQNNTQLMVSETYVSYKNYWSFYWNESGVESPVGSSSALGSRLFDREATQSNQTRVRNTIQVLAGVPGEYTFNSVELVSGGQVFLDASDPFSGVLPAWRKAYFNNIISRPFTENATDEEKQKILQDITFNKVAAAKKITPQTGTYMNEGDRLDPEYEEDFYGSNYHNFRGIKAKYDPHDLFYCPTCVGSREWMEEDDGKLCKVQTTI